MKPRRPVLRYHGGKWRLAPWIISHFPEHRTYVEPFGGAGSVLMRKPRCYAEVYNDLWGDVVNVFRVLRDRRRAAELREQLKLTPFSREEFEAPWRKGRSMVERARRTVFRSFAGFGSASTNGDYNTGFRSNSNRSHTTPAHDWANYPDLIESFTERLAGVVIEHRPSHRVIDQHDGPQTLIYLDPPYPLGTRNVDRGNAHYVCEMTDDDHRVLAEQLHLVRGFVVISGYPCDLYDRQLYPNWQRVQTTAFADGARPRTEVLWLNPACSAALKASRVQLEMA